MKKVRWIHSITVLSTIAAVLVLSATGSGNSGHARDSEDRSVAASLVSTQVRACVSYAKRHVEGQWTCLNDMLAWRDTARSSAGQWQERRIPLPKATIRLASDWYGDVKCEPTGICNRLKDEYTGFVKGNAYFGEGGQTYGSFDIEWKQRFSGRMPQWWLHLNWDSGSGIDSDEWIAVVRRERFGPDTNWTSRKIGGGDVNQFDQFWSSGRIKPPRALTIREDWHDDLKGAFYSRGRRWVTGTLHTGRWRTDDAEGFDLHYKEEWY